MKIYVLNYESVYAGDKINKVLGSYTKIEKARERYEQEKEKIREQYKDEYTCTCTSERKDDFEIWDGGNYDGDHVSLVINEAELDFDFRMAYWKEVAESPLEAVQTDLEGDYSNLSDEEKDKILEESADEFINDEVVWDVIDAAMRRIVEDKAQELVEGGK